MLQQYEIVPCRITRHVTAAIITGRVSTAHIVVCMAVLNGFETRGGELACLRRREGLAGQASKLAANKLGRNQWFGLWGEGSRGFAGRDAVPGPVCCPRCPGWPSWPRWPRWPNAASAASCGPSSLVRGPPPPSRHVSEHPTWRDSRGETSRRAAPCTRPVH